MKTGILTILLWVLGPNALACGIVKDTVRQRETKPNIILILIDDLGFSDVGCYGRTYGQSFIETPRIDGLAKQGMKFTNAYAAAPLCSPSRAALLTGKTPARLGFEFVTKYPDDDFKWNDSNWLKKYEDKKLIPPPFTLNLALEETTVAEMMKQADYSTAIVGKWHVASHYKRYNGWNLDFGPLKQGFDFAAETFGSHPYGTAADDKLAKIQDGEFLPDEITSKAIEFIKEDHRNPFFLFVSHYYVHTPLDNRMKWLIEKYSRKAVSAEEKKRVQYAAFVETMDYYVGRLLDAVRAAGIEKNTVIVFTSDNGGHPQFAYNRPFRGGKWSLYEGGLRVPMIVKWPAVAKENLTIDIPVSQIDFLATFADIAGLNKASLPDSSDGRSLLDIFRGYHRKNEKERLFIWHFPYYHPEGEKYDQSPPITGIEDGVISRTTPQSAIRKGNYKAIYFFESDSLELYDLKRDPSEQKNLSNYLPQKATMLKKELLNYLDKVHARKPIRNGSTFLPKQLTKDKKGHCLNNTQCFSPDDNWLVYDTRNDDTKIGSTGRIEMVNVQTGEMRLLYQTENQSDFGPGVGAATFNPVTQQVMFIHGIRNANAKRPYGFTRRTGVAIDVSKPGTPVFLDARDVIPPFTPGALRGGTHAHTWSGDGKWISFTYNDDVVATLEANQSGKQELTTRDLRTVGVMFPDKPVVVSEKADGENNNGSMFSVTIADVTEKPVPGSNEISKAFDECWIGENGYTAPSGERHQRAIAFQGHVVDSQGHTKTDIFVADLPQDLSKARFGLPLEGTVNGRPYSPQGINIRRITRLAKGVAATPRHWLRSTRDGSTVGFLKEDDNGHIQLFGVSPNGGEIKQLSFQPFSIQGSFNFSPDGKHAAYVADNSVFITQIGTGKFIRLTERVSDETRPIGAVNWSNNGGMLAWNAYVGDENRFLQIFIMQLNYNDDKISK